MRALLPWLPRDARAFSAEAHRRLSRASHDSRAAHDLRRRRAAAARALAATTTSRTGALDARANTGARSRPPSAWLRDLRRGDPDAHGRRPPARALPVVGHRLVGDRLPAGGDGLQPAAVVHRRVSRAPRSTKARRRAHGGGAPGLAATSTCRFRSGVAADFARIVADLDEPFADPSSVPTWYLARETTRHVKVVLGGDGGDEMFGGYKRYAKHLRTRWRRGLVLPALRCPDGDRRRRLAAARRGAAARLARARTRCASPASRPASARCSRRKRRRRRTTGGCRPTGGRADLATLLEIDRLNYLPDYILRKADLMHDGARARDARAVPRPPLRRRARAALPARERFTTPPKRLLAPALARAGRPRPVRAARSAASTRRIAGWLEGDLAPRLPGLGARLAALTGGQLDARARRRASSRPGATAAGPRRADAAAACILDESLAQLAALAASRR